MKLAFRPLKELYGMSSAAEFGPLSLQAVRERPDPPAGTAGRSELRRRLWRSPLCDARGYADRLGRAVVVMVTSEVVTRP